MAANARAKVDRQDWYLIEYDVTPRPRGRLNRCRSSASSESMLPYTTLDQRRDCELLDRLICFSFHDRTEEIVCSDHEQSVSVLFKRRASKAQLGCSWLHVYPGT
jgi:hypothetical protein